jgi:hypothetical protein
MDRAVFQGRPQPVTAHLPSSLLLDTRPMERKSSMLRPLAWNRLAQDEQNPSVVRVPVVQPSIQRARQPSSGCSRGTDNTTRSASHPTSARNCGTVKDV